MSAVQNTVRIKAMPMFLRFQRHFPTPGAPDAAWGYHLAKQRMRTIPSPPQREVKKKTRKGIKCYVPNTKSKNTLRARAAKKEKGKWVLVTSASRSKYELVDVSKAKKNKKAKKKRRKKKKKRAKVDDSPMSRAVNRLVEGLEESKRNLSARIDGRKYDWDHINLTRASLEAIARGILEQSPARGRAGRRLTERSSPRVAKARGKTNRQTRRNVSEIPTTASSDTGESSDQQKLWPSDYELQYGALGRRDVAQEQQRSPPSASVTTTSLDLTRPSMSVSSLDSVEDRIRDDLEELKAWQEHFSSKLSGDDDSVVDLGI